VGRRADQRDNAERIGNESTVSYETIKTREKFDGEVIEVTLDAPPANILNARMMGEISDLLQQYRDNPKLKLIIFRGEGENFCFGASVEEHAADKVGSMLPQFHNLIGEILEYPVATLAQVRGFCLGGGFELALACSFIAADDKAKFAVPEIQLGVFPPVAAALLPCLTSGSLAARMVLTGARLKAVELKAAGLTMIIAENADIEAAVDSFIEKEIRQLSASSLRIAQRACRMSIVQQYRRLIGDLEKLYLGELMSTPDANEGIQSFLEKRRPVWVGN
jgi:cyclohexa-1,5-dienecarbonyl-CoA hydratase